MSKHRHQCRRVGQAFAGGFAKDHALYPAEDCGKCDTQCDEQKWRRPWVGMHGGSDDQEFTREDPEWGHAEDGQRADGQAPADGGVGRDQAADVFHQLGAGLLSGMTDGKKDR